MSKVVGVEIEGLFGYVGHVVAMRADSPTIITAPNGAGKTHILTLLSGALSLNLRVLFLTSYESFRIEFADGRALSVKRSAGPDLETTVTLSAEKSGRVVGAPLTLGTSELEAAGSTLPSFIRKIDGNRWLDRRTGRVLTRAAILRRYPSSVSEIPEELRSRSPEVMDLCSGPPPVFIDTKRLDVSSNEPGDADYAVTRAPAASDAVTRIHEYVEQLRYEVTEARRSSVQATQSADLSFAARALAAAKLSVNEARLHKRYDETVERYEDLARNSLAVGDAPMEFPEKTTPTVRRILNIFLDDWDKRLEPLLPLNAKIQTLRDIVDAKLAASGKRTSMSPRGGLEFRSARGARIRVADLSSGEQHMVALFTLLLFSASPGSLVLIDEPEISFHAAWKHAFLDDISRVSKISDLQVVVATHSAGIINGRWDLTEMLTFNHSDDPEFVGGTEDTHDEGYEFDE